MGVGGQRHAPAALPPGKCPGIDCIRGWVGPRAGLDGCGKSLSSSLLSKSVKIKSCNCCPLLYTGVKLGRSRRDEQGVSFRE